MLFVLSQVIGSSLLLLFDQSNEANVWMIDFAKTRLLDKSTPITHRAPWAVGNHEDGYLTGLDNLIQVHLIVCDIMFPVAFY